MMVNILQDIGFQSAKVAGMVTGMDGHLIMNNASLLIWKRKEFLFQREMKRDGYHANKVSEGGIMGLLDIILAGPRVEHAKTALVGKYVFDNASAQLKKDITNHSIDYFHKNRPIQSFAKEESATKYHGMHDKVRFIFVAAAITEMGIDHKLKGFYMSFPNNPFTVEFYGDNIWWAAKQRLLKEYGISVEIN